MSTPCDIIEPCGFVWSEKKLRRAGMDYLDQAALNRHRSWSAYQDWRQDHAPKSRLILLSTKATNPYHQFEFSDGDILLFGQESAGVPDDIHEGADHRLIIPMAEDKRSINLALSVAMCLGEALRQTNSFPKT
jgi:tRNA (cytidine/uridine-2'-O-)-methyltransferase